MPATVLAVFYVVYRYLNAATNHVLAHIIEPAGPLIASQVRQGILSPALVIPDCLIASRCPCR
jgi:hypothetical protein